MKHTQPQNDVVDKLNAFFIYKHAGSDRVREIMPQQTNFCEANSNKTYDELRHELLKSNNTDTTR